MARFAPDKTLLDVSRVSKKEYNAWQRGVHLQSFTNRQLEDLRHRAAADRLGLGADFFRSGQKVLLLPSPEFRSAISRFYYSMYHAGRSVVYFQERGDDHEEHSQMPQHLPPDFVDRNLWINRLTSARLARNRADYDPYPKAPAGWRPDAENLQFEAQAFLRLCKQYLNVKACKYT